MVFIIMNAAKKQSIYKYYKSDTNAESTSVTPKGLLKSCKHLTQSFQGEGQLWKWKRFWTRKTIRSQRIRWLEDVERMLEERMPNQVVCEYIAGSSNEEDLGSLRCRRRN